MKKNYFILVVAHSVHGRLKRLHIPHIAIHITICLAIFGAIAGVGLMSSYGRMLWKVAEFNDLRTEKEALQKQLDELSARVEEREVQLASLGNLANEVSIAFGIKRGEAGGDLLSEAQPAPSYENFLQQYDRLQQFQASDYGSSSAWFFLENTTPSIWPVKGAFNSSFGRRSDPFTSISAFHPGVDLSGARGTPVVATADGIVAEAGWYARYGKRVLISHGQNQLTTHYAHLNDFYVRPGQVVRRGEVIGAIGATGRATSPHLHYEVRLRGTPLNPYKFLRTPKNPRDGGLVVAD